MQEMGLEQFSANPAIPRVLAINDNAILKKGAKKGQTSFICFYIQSNT